LNPASQRRVQSALVRAGDDIIWIDQRDDSPMRGRFVHGLQLPFLDAVE
jgi:hypothetical protein